MSDLTSSMPNLITQPSASQYLDLASLNALKGEANQDPDAAVEKVAKQFESIFIQMMLKSMRSTVPKDGLFASHQMETYQDMADQQTALSMAETGGIGLAEVIKRQLTLDGNISESSTNVDGAYPSIGEVRGQHTLGLGPEA